MNICDHQYRPVCGLARTRIIPYKLYDSICKYRRIEDISLFDNRVRVGAMAPRSACKKLNLVPTVRHDVAGLDQSMSVFVARERLVIYST
jgi:hypothetical protein